MANAWGELSWNSGLWGQQSDAIAAPTGLALNIAEGNEAATPNQGWGALYWGEGEWGNIPDNAANITGIQQNISLGSVTAEGVINVGWGRNEWGAKAWGITGSLLAQGEQVNLGVGSVTVDAEVNTGWGRSTWGDQDWGTTGTSVISSVSGIRLNVNLGTAVGFTNVGVDVTGNALTSAEGIVDPSPDATVIGIGLTAGIAVGSVIEADANVTTTGIGLKIAQGQAELEAVTIAQPVTGSPLVLGTGLRSAVAGASAEVTLTGNGLTATVNSINVQSWQIVDTGTSVSWNDIDTAA